MLGELATFPPLFPPLLHDTCEKIHCINEPLRTNFTRNWNKMTSYTENIYFSCLTLFNQQKQHEY